jgi:hypothetical protein
MQEFRWVNVRFMASFCICCSRVPFDLGQHPSYTPQAILFFGMCEPLHSSHIVLPNLRHRHSSSSLLYFPCVAKQAGRDVTLQQALKLIIPMPPLTSVGKSCPSSLSCFPHVIREEVMTLQALRHPNILQYLGACMMPPNLVMVTEHLPHSLHSILYSMSGVDLDRKRAVSMLQVQWL